jgi:hypothetical protein
LIYTDQNKSVKKEVVKKKESITYVRFPRMYLTDIMYRSTHALRPGCCLC